MNDCPVCGKPIKKGKHVYRLYNVIAHKMCIAGVSRPVDKKVKSKGA